MDLNCHPCSFFGCTFAPIVSKSCNDKSYYEEAGVFLLNMVEYRIDDTVQRVTFVYILMSIFKFYSFHDV